MLEFGEYRRLKELGYQKCETNRLHVLPMPKIASYSCHRQLESKELHYLQGASWRNQDGEEGPAKQCQGEKRHFLQGQGLALG